MIQTYPNKILHKYFPGSQLSSPIGKLDLFLNTFRHHT